MSIVFPRFLRPITPATARSYSFFSSKPGGGGGRSFAAPKPPKPGAVAPASTKGSSSSASPSNQSDVDEAALSPTLPTPDVNASDASASSSTGHSSPTESVDATVGSSASSSVQSPSTAPFQLPTMPSYPILTPNDLKVHQFFSIHRPLFLNQPSASVFDSYPSLRLRPTSTTSPSSSSSNPSAEEAEVEASMKTFDDPPEASPEADADAARLLARALVINRVGSTVSWDETMRRLGWKGEDSVGVLTMPVEEEVGISASVGLGNRIDMDSIRRKRRRKMKKHKLKKRRKLSRSSRLRTGR